MKSIISNTAEDTILWHKDCKQISAHKLNNIVMKKVKRTFSSFLEYIRKAIFVEDVI
ncbi:hypothetical protein [Chryseobacterium profundimaris]|uniref:Transposase n=1 Tax=Chryseobacterium profundimaris TaxID=1387275 RepID=A0ABY1P261_9FLAO|nr:hypothetical protein [Chryseobacterium profundimaris]SMP24663.1 hypothetical protein SAMN06264346_10883 [Chryseobacterium profundimaris]